ncbi:CHASE domain-containing protein [Halopseudomonas pachastrellae]|nr:CHASE domain-containing protein [Halopseudomonas pachastrellae]
MKKPYALKALPILRASTRPRPFYTAILYLEPFKGRNLAAFGDDMFSEPVRREAMQAPPRAARHGLPGRCGCCKKPMARCRPGFSCTRPSIIAVRRWKRRSNVNARYADSFYSPYRMGDLLDGILGSRTPGVRYRITDTAAGLEFPQLYSDLTPDSGKALYQRSLDLLFMAATGDWTLPAPPALNVALSPVPGYCYWAGRSPAAVRPRLFAGTTPRAGRAYRPSNDAQAARQ